MTNNIELELQLRITDKNNYGDIVCDPLFCTGWEKEQPQTVNYETTYFDTVDHRLQKNRYAFRIRKSEDEISATIKDDGLNRHGLFKRNEWNIIIEADHPAIGIFSDLPIGKIFEDIIGEEPLLPVFKTCIKRTFAKVRANDGSLIELSADIGEIVSGDKTEEICEIEFELKSGCASSLFKKAEEFSRQYSLVPEEKSKYLRGIILAGLATDEENPKKIHSEKMHPEKQYKENMFCGILEDPFYAIIKAEGDFVKCPDDPETAHRIRVKVRKFRSVLYMVKSLLDRDEYMVIQEELRVYARGFSRIRELDVLKIEWEKFSLMRTDRTQGALTRSNTVNDESLNGTVFFDWIKKQRENEKAKLLEYISSGKSTPAHMKIRACVEELGQARETVEETKMNDALKKRLYAKWKAFEKNYKKTDFSDPKAVHALRIQCKRLYYSLNILYAGRGNHKRIQSKLKKLQNDLGKLCDLYRFIQMAGEFAESNKTDQLQYEIGTFIGYQTALGERLQNKLKRRKSV